MNKLHCIFGAVASALLLVSCGPSEREAFVYDFDESLFGFSDSVYVEDWARTDYYTKVRSEQNSRPTVAFYGDSITECWWLLDSGFFTNHGWLCLGIGGQTSSHLLVRFRTDILELHPSKVVIMCGTNDIALNGGAVRPEITLGNIMSMCELAQAYGITPILCSITPCDYYAWRPEVGSPAARIEALNDAIKAYADASGIRYVDYHALLDDGNGALPEKYTVDRCHLSLEAYHLIEAEIEKYL